MHFSSFRWGGVQEKIIEETVAITKEYKRYVCFLIGGHQSCFRVYGHA